MGVEVQYQAPQTFDMVAMQQLIDAAVASQPDGLVVSIPDAEALGNSIRAAVAAGIPVISIRIPASRSATSWAPSCTWASTSTRPALLPAKK